MTKRKPAEPPHPELEPNPRQPRRSLLVASGVILAAWVLFLLLVALRVV